VTKLSLFNAIVATLVATPNTRIANREVVYVQPKGSTDVIEVF
jgi:hypothetical protein